MLQHIEAEASDVREGQVRDDAIVRTNSLRLLTLGHTGHDIGLPGQGIMTQHAALRIAGSTACVNQAACHTRLLQSHLRLDDIVLDRDSSLQEVLPEHEAWATYIIWQGRLTPDDEGLDPIVLV